MTTEYTAIDAVACLTPRNVLDGVGVTRMRTFWRGDMVKDKKSIGATADGPLPDYPDTLSRTDNTNEWGVAKWGRASWAGANAEHVNTFRDDWETVNRKVKNAVLETVVPTIQVKMDYSSESNSELVRIELEVAETETRGA